MTWLCSILAVLRSQLAVGDVFVFREALEGTGSCCGPLEGFSIL